MQHSLNSLIKTSIIFLIINLISINYVYNAQTRLSADVYASYFGGSGEEFMVFNTVDRYGNVIIAGHTTSANLPTHSAYQNNLKASPDGFIAKFNPDMTEIIFSTYLGGNNYDEIKDIEVDSSGNIYVVGLTISTDFPVTLNAFDNTLNNPGNDSAMDAFLTKLSPNGEILYSTYLGGSDYDCGMTLSIINSSVIYIGGMTNSSDFYTKSAYSDSLKGGGDLFFLKIDISTNEIVFSTLFGGAGNESSYTMDLKTDQSGNIYITGNTNSSDFPVKNYFQSSFGGGDQDGFIAKFNSSGELVYSSFIGGSGNEIMGGIDVTDNGEVYFIGSSNSPGLPCSSNAFLREPGRNGMGIIIGKVNQSGDSLLYFSYFGGTYYDQADYGRIHHLSKDIIIVTGGTYYYQVSPNAYDRTSNESEFLIAILNTTRRQVLYSTYLGGTSYDSPYDLTFINDSTFFVSGSTSASDFPVTTNALYRNFAGGNNDAVFAKLNFDGLKITGINEDNHQSPFKSSLYQNYPNPFNPSTTISYSLDKPAQVRLSINNLLGQEIKVLKNEFQRAGEYSVCWDGVDEMNNQVSSGIYFYSLETNKIKLHKKMLLVR